ncbi:MAG: GGDEF domain-containing protein [Eubacterium sp.]|nr:GGDEF domain-containing protein [Eubacterium sp.]
MGEHRKLVALCTSRVYDTQIHGFIETLNEKLRTESASLLVFTMNSDIYWDETLVPAETYVYDIIPYEDLDCLILMDEKIKSHSIAQRILSRSKENHVPVIVIDGSYEDTIHVRFDYAKGFEQIARHIIEYHHARLPHMMAGIPGDVFSEERIDIFKKILAENGIPFDDSMVSYGDFWADPTREATLLLLKRETLPDAVICANDIMTINVSAVLEENGIRVPEDVLVSGFDGFEQIFFSTPKISSASCDSVLLAEAAGDTAVRLIRGETCTHRLIPPKLIPNESCGCPSMMWHAHAILSSFNNSFYRHQDDVRILYDISTAMETSLTPYEMASRIHQHKTKHHLTVVDRHLFDTDQNYFLIPKENMQTRNLHMINDADYAEEHRFVHIPVPDEVWNDQTVNEKESVLSGGYRNRILELTESGYPLIFNALDYLNRPFGFACYYFQDYAITDYSRSATITNALNMGIGGYVNLQHQRILLEKMDAMYKHDALTGLYNRLGFHNAYEKVFAAEADKGTPVTLIMSDLDGLKYINDHYGHADGDRAIAAVASAMLKACPDDALSARFGGDELFSVIIGECDPEKIISDIDRYLEEFNASIDLPYVIATSSGSFTTTLTKGYDILKSLKVADDKMYAVKNAKRDAGNYITSR